MKITVAKNAEKDVRVFFKEEILKAKQDVFKDLEKTGAWVLKTNRMLRIFEEDYLVLKHKHLHPISDNSTKKTVISTFNVKFQGYENESKKETL